MTVQKVARDVVETNKINKKGEKVFRKFAYRDVRFDEGGWADAKLFLPADFDLLFIKTKEKTYPGWSVGTKWDGLNVPEGLEVLYWKRQD